MSVCKEVQYFVAECGTQHSNLRYELWIICGAVGSKSKQVMVQVGWDVIINKLENQFLKVLN